MQLESYEKPELTITLFQADDVITFSPELDEYEIIVNPPKP